jgi:glucose-6-phosphate isomerase
MKVNDSDSTNESIRIPQILTDILDGKLQITGINDFEFKEFKGFAESPYNILNDKKYYDQTIPSFMAGIDNVVLVSTGGSNLGARSFVEICSIGSEHSFHYANSTNEYEILKLMETLDLNKTGFLIASKSGDTVEILSLFKYFYNEIDKISSTNITGDQFIAITEAGSLLDHIARQYDFHDIIHTDSSLVGRFSVFSPFGTCLAYMAGVSLENISTGAISLLEIVKKHDSGEEISDLIYFIFDAWKSNKDKLVIVFSKSLYTFALWIEQIIAESLGKEGKGIIPIIQEHSDKLKWVSEDSIVVFLRDKHSDDFDSSVMGNPYLLRTITIENDVGLAFEMMKWQLITITLATLMSLNPFNQPQVELSKQLARKFIDDPQLPKPIFDIKESHNCLIDLFKMIKKSNYVCLLNYVNESAEIMNQLNSIVDIIVETLKVPCVVQNAPSYLHATGQLHKGGLNNGVFVQFLSAECQSNILIPENDHTFGSLFIAQADGDFVALNELGRKICRIYIGTDFEESFERFRNFLQ